MKLEKKHNGVIVPMITPLNNDLTIDCNAVNVIIDSFISNGVSPFILGTTGEGPSLTCAQKEELVKATVNRVKGRTIVYAGISSNCILTSIEDAKKYSELGIDAVAATLPAYYPMDNGQIIKHFTTLADASPCPLIVYNMPATVKISIPLDVIEVLSKHPNIVGIKDSEADKDRIVKTISIAKKNDNFVYLLGWAAQSSYAMMHGADGIVPSIGNFVPQLYTSLIEAVKNKNQTQAEFLQKKTDEISLLCQKDRTLSEVIPALKTIMYALDICQPTVMPPMYKMEKEQEDQFVNKIKKVLNTLIMA